MLEENILLVIALFFIMALLYLASQKFKISYPIFLVIGGLVISFIPGIPGVSIKPEIVFLIFLPPLLFEAAWYTSWHSFWRWRRSIFTMGFGVVFFTATTVAYFAAEYIPGFTLALGFLLGGIISPPDAVAATSVLKNMNMPKRGLTILEGESLVNDAASLTVFKFALAAILTGTFVWQKAATEFLSLSIMGILFGLAVAHILYVVLRFISKDSMVTTPLMLIAPYLMYLGAEQFHWSGVLSVVSGGLFLSFRSKDFLDYNTRIQTKEVLETVGFLLNGFVFILIGLELPVIIEGMEEYSLTDAVKYALIISLVVIVVRIVLVYTSAFVPRFFSRKIRNREKSPGLKLPFIIGWSGMRGVVSLASALAIPLTLDNGEAFPLRDLILFITFIVILITLVFQGLTLPLILRWFKMEEIDEVRPVDEQIETIRLELAKVSVEYLDHNYAEQMEQYETIARIKEQLQRSIHVTEKARTENSRDVLFAIRKLNYEILIELIHLRRHNLHQLKRLNQFDDHVIREIEHGFDLEEARLKSNFLK